MTETFAFSPDEAARRVADEATRLIECATERIRTIGRIQSYGFLLGVDEMTGVVVLASANAEHLLGRVLRTESSRLDWILRHGSALDPVRTELDGQTVDVIVHRDSTPMLVEFETVIPEMDYARTGVVNTIHRMSAVKDIDSVWTAVADEIKTLTGFDRVMCYDFHADGHGQIVADAREPEMEPYFGLHFPASDIPAQARALYIEKRSRIIADTEDPGVPLLTLLDEAEPVDLGPTELRSASPHHLTFMRNMGQAATLSLSLVEDGRLVGMITCAHRTPRRLPVLMRRALEVLATQVTSQISSLRRIADLQRQLDSQERRSAVLGSLFERPVAGEALTEGERTLLDIVPSDGALLQLSGAAHTVGVVPPPAALLRIVDQLGPGRHVIEDLPIVNPAAVETLPGVAGLLVVPLGAGDRIVFVRSEVAQTVEWLGDQRPDNRDTQLSPRRSFTAWRESVNGRSLAWGSYAQDAFEFGDSLRAALDSRVQAELAGLAYRDPLTGLYNRRYLDRLLEDTSAAERAAMNVIFFDVDDFKAVNDTHGHKVGDVVLRALGRRLQGLVREADSAVRLGGDEFLIVCPATEFADAQEIAARALTAIAQPMRIDGVTLSIDVSVGVAAGGGDMLATADAAMYRAKKAGGGRISV